MGDFISPKRRDVFHRLRRRIESYRQRQGDTLSHYQPQLSGMYEHQIQETSHLHQKWLESKMKRHNSRKSSQKDDSGNFEIGGSGRQKRKHDYMKNSESTSGQHDAEEMPAKIAQDELKPPDCQINGTFSNPQDRAPNIPHSEPLQNSVSVQGAGIMSQSSCANSVPIDSKSGLISSCLSAENDKTVTKSLLCKEEPVDISEQCHGSNSSHNSFPDIEDVDELQAILESLTEDGDDMHADILKDMDLSIKDVVGQCSAEPKSKSNKSSKNPNPAFDKKHPCGQMNLMPSEQMFDNQSSGKYCDPRIPPISYAPSQSPFLHANENAEPQQPHLLGDTGPAAETLKQMAAQHQNQTHNQEDSQFGKTSAPNSFNGKCFPGPMRGDSNQQQFNFPANNGYPPGHITSSYSEDTKLPISPPVMPQQMGIDVNFGATKPLSHYGGNMMSDPNMVPPLPPEPSSSLQQLQNQVHSHFNQGSAESRPSAYVPHPYSSASSMQVSPQVPANHMNMHGAMHNQHRFNPDQSVSVEKTRMMAAGNLPQVSHHSAVKAASMPGQRPGPPAGMCLIDKKPAMPLSSHPQPNTLASHPNKRGPVENNFASYMGSHQAKAFAGVPPDCQPPTPYHSAGNEMPMCSQNPGYVQKRSMPVASRQYPDPAWNNSCGKMPGSEAVHPPMPMRSVEYGYTPGPPGPSNMGSMQSVYGDSRYNIPHNHNRPVPGHPPGPPHGPHGPGMGVIRNHGNHEMMFDNRNIYNPAAAGPNQGNSLDRKMVDPGGGPHPKAKMKPQPHMMNNMNQYHPNMGHNRENNMNPAMYQMDPNYHPSSHNYM